MILLPPGGSGRPAVHTRWCRLGRPQIPFRGGARWHRGASVGRTGGRLVAGRAVTWRWSDDGELD
jgi:hypothetical protein